MNAKLFTKYATNPSSFRNDLLVDVNGSVKKFGDVQDPWQRDDFAALDAGLTLCNGRSESITEDTRLRIYLERPRGHSKTTDLAVTCTWALAFATRPLKSYAFAADRDQAVLLKNAIETLVRLNPWLARILEVQKLGVVNIAKGHPGEGSTLEIQASDVGSSYGLLADLIICDEVTHWGGDGSLWHSIISTAAKRSNCLLAVISNAGFVDSWAWSVRETAREDDAWIFSRLDGPVASWISPRVLAEQRRMLPAIAYSRLWENNWSTGGGDALSPEVIERAFVDGLQPVDRAEQGWLYVAGVDLGITRDSSAVVVLAVPDGGRAGRIRLAHHKVWRPILGQKIDLLDVERHLLDLDRLYELEFVAFDPWQAEHLAQTLEADAEHIRRNSRRVYGEQPWMRDIPPLAANLRQQATLTIEYFNDRRLELYDCEPLRRDLNKLRVEEKSYGVRLTSPRDGEGHGDSFSAFALALLMASEVASNAPVVLKPILFGGPGGESSDDPDGFAERQREYAREMAELSKPNDDPTGLKDALSSGRVQFGPNFPSLW